ncbi:MAG: TonB-dependent receptor [Brevundimonas sp.]|uniref:TonB-dependent receptor n=1 Tax=Brevundimonas sp. TaxID=1871086 RepID=UPI0024893BA3|nr:TonB-dependent receptor [Brevundimonas sp.]MDI1327543.1 TonB-dependent receptor [Brevundimonas sp.]
MALTAVPVVALVVPTNAMAQSQSGSLRISVAGQDGQPLSGATITVSSPDSLVSKTAVTGEDGRARLSGLDPATNYTVQVVAAGYDEFRASNVAVVSGRDLSQGYVLVSGARADADADATDLGDIIVTGTSLAAVDVTSATVGTTLTLQTVEALPTGRNYQSYLQLVPGVKPSSGGNAASRSGVNYSDVGGAIGSSTDNLYYLDGVDVTDPVTGTFGANFNSEIIQEQQVIVGGVPAEYAGGSGLVSRVVTKSGSNEWHGSINYYLQNDDLVAEDEHSTSGGFSTYDSAVTLGGPILHDRLWFFGSYQKKNREDEVLNVGTGDILRTVENDQDYLFSKLTWQVTDNDRVTATFFSDPTEISGQNSATIINSRDYSRTQGGDNYKLEYTRTWGDLLFDAYYFKHESELTDVALNSSIRDNVTYRTAANASLEQRQLGGRGINFEEHRDREEWGLNAEYFLDTSFGTHTIKGGVQRTENIYFQTDSVPGGVTYNSLDDQYLGTTLGTYRGAGWTARSITSTDYAQFLLPALSANAAALAAYDTNHNGAISAAEADAIVFNSTAGNPYGGVNVYRTVRAADAPYEVSSEGTTLYLQDTWTLNQLTVNAGLRAEKWDHFASDGSQIADFDWAIAPRLSVVYDVFGDGRSKVFGFAGRYYDPIRNDMTDFAGAKTGPVNNEQIYAAGQWITFRTRGPGDAAISPSTKTPYTDEFMIGGSTTIGSSIGLSATLTHRVTEDIMEDYDLSLYADATCTQATCGVNGAAYPGSLFYLGLPYFGYSSDPGTNYVIGTLAGGKREYTGFEVVLTKFKTDNWFGQVSYTFNDAEGNSNSDGNADFQGDWIALDPRAPNVWGPQAGNIPHQFKAYGAYEFNFGLEVSGVFNWNSGSLYTPADVVQSRYLPPMSGGYEFGGVTDSYILPGFVGAEQNPAYYTFDMRLKYVLDLPIGETEFFLDAFNVLNNQAATGEVANRAGSGQYVFQEANSWVAPRRFYLGVRYSF